MRKCSSKEFINYCENKYPKIKHNVAYRRMLFYLFFGTYRDFDYKRLILSRPTLLRIMQVEDKHRNVRVIEFLESFKRNVLPEFCWTDYHKSSSGWYGKCRMVQEFGIDDDTWKRVAQEFRFEGKRYYFDTGRVLSKSISAKTKSHIHQEYLENRKFFNLNSTQELIIQSLETIDPRTFTRKINQNKNLILNAIDELKDDSYELTTPLKPLTLDEKKRRQRNILGAIEDEPMVYYAPTLLERTPRLHSCSPSILSFQSSIRKVACKGWTEVDLISSQLHILAGIIGATHTQAFLASNTNIWQYLSGSKNVDPYEKAVLKKVIYGICFGTAETRARKNHRSIKQLLKLIDKAYLINDPIIRELLNKRKIWFDNIAHYKSLTDVWGNEHKLAPKGETIDRHGNRIEIKERWEGSLAATKIQSIEMELISAVFEYEKRYSRTNQFKIVLFQHDGFTISVNSEAKRQTIYNGLNKAIAAKASELGKRLNIDLSNVKLKFSEL